MWSIKNCLIERGSLRLHVEAMASDSAITFLTGPSGSGKTSLFQVLTGQMTANPGWSFQVAGEELATLSTSERRLGVVMQTFDLFPQLSAERNVRIIMKARQALGASAEDELMRLRDLLALRSCWQTPAERLSGGERQRVSLLRALMSRPRLILLDEPFSALDEAIRLECRALVASALATCRVPTLMITHDRADISALRGNEFRVSAGHVVGPFPPS
jgi:ABC-type nitrate/sulfonate/bicarbonate transport system ATPase subunit